jgi:hypothetical protein
VRPHTYIPLALLGLLVVVIIVGLSRNTNISGTITETHGGPGLKGATYVTCKTHVEEFNVYVVPSSDISKYHPGQPCPPGEKW